MADATRGEFLSLTTIGLGAMIGGVIGVPATAYLLAPVTKEATFEPVFLGPLDKFTGESGFKPTPATYIEDPENAATSPGLAFVHYTGSKNSDWHAHDAMFVVFSNRCMHLGLPHRGDEPRVRLPLPRRPVRHQRRAHGRPADPLARPLPVGGPKGSRAVDHPALEHRHLRRRGALLPR